VADIINLLPDNIANQIAAGEVIQRPASAVKELLENAVDAGATSIHLIIKDAGKELIKVIDNGKGMSGTDARLCFERHATSKIKNIEDLFSIRTMGFRGEALASVAAVAQVELKTKQATDEAGTLIQIENSKVSLQEQCSTADGTSIAIKNLFYNVPARRNFLKSTTTEIRHIVDEFTRVAMAWPNIAFRLTNNDTDLFQLEIGSLKQRIVALLGNNFNSKLVPVKEHTEYLSIDGFVCTPDAASKTRGNQFFFVNNRFIKSAYLGHALNQAYSQLLNKDSYPAFVLFIDIDPQKIDANVHPTKQEIKFEDDRIVYAFINSAVKQSLSKNSIAPSIDFDLDHSITSLSSISQPFSSFAQEKVIQQNIYKGFTQGGQSHSLGGNRPSANWSSLYNFANDVDNSRKGIAPNEENSDTEQIQPPIVISDPYLFMQGYIAYPKTAGVLLIHIKKAIERIKYDQLMLNISQTQPVNTQKLLHPITFELNPADSILLENLLEDCTLLGFQIESFGGQTFIIQGVPTEVKVGKEVKEIELILEQFKTQDATAGLGAREKLIRTIAMRKAMYSNEHLSKDDIKDICNKIFASTQPEFTPRGEKIFVTISKQEIEQKFHHF
jgi:DNA mismatch repair protein MutL